MAGFNKLMRYCDTLAEYEQAKADGIVTDDVLVIVLEEKVAKFKGETFDWSGSGTSIDPDMSDTSTNPVQNKAIKSYVDASSANVKAYTDAEVAKKVDKVAGKQLSTEDFTTALKTKLEGLNNYDDTELSEAVARLRDDFDSLTQEDISAAIENFNEIISFLDGIEDSESLDSIIASIEQQIANKQDKIEDLETIRSGAALGSTALQEHQDISHLATKEEVTNLQNEVIANEEVSAAAFNEINERIEQLSENVSGVAATKEELAEAVTTLNESIATKQDTLVSGTNIKTLNGESILGEGDIVLNVDTSSLATKEELESLTNEVITNEEVSAAAFNEINDRINAISENVSGTTVTKDEFESTVTTINESIATKQDTLVSGTSIKTINGVSVLGEGNIEINVDTSALATKEEVTTLINEVITNEEISAAALNELNERVVTPYEYYKGKGGVVSESAYNIMTKYLFTPFIISNNSTTTIPDELLNESQTSFFTDYYWNFMRLTGGEPIRTTQWANNIPQKFVGISSGLSFVIDFSNKTITPEQ